MNATDSNSAPETYELPPEPPIGSRVRDHSGREWVRDASIGWKSEDESRVTIVGWALLMGYHGPLTRIPDPEPDPWPTAPLIVADWQDGYETQGRGLLVTDGPTPSECYVVLTGDDDYDGYRLLRHKWDGDTLHNVVPVTVVPTAEWEAWMKAGEVRNLGPDRRATFERATISLRAATDALGLDL